MQFNSEDAVKILLKKAKNLPFFLWMDRNNHLITKKPRTFQNNHFCPKWFSTKPNGNPAQFD